ncbi:response regulator [Parasalinivibrio latis]|uniref:HD-GYP domain-containing protein n=1 Tax=Parasalinivibrio latis TaxID=2952610 RepID=UPI0030E2C5D9
MHKEKPVVLVVDDASDNIAIVKSILCDTYRVKAALSGDVALKIARSCKKPDIILLDIMMPVMDGYDVCKALKASPETNHIPVIFLTAKSGQDEERKGLELGAVDYISKPFSSSIVKARVDSHLALYDQTRQLEKMVDERTSEMNDNFLQMVHILARVSSFKDDVSNLHVMRVGWYASLIAEQMGEQKEFCECIFSAASLHDIGKVGIPDSILQKQGKLSDEEMLQMQRHVDIGLEIIGNFSSMLFNMAREIIMYHHERWDGSGYPVGLEAEEIPVSARIVGVADVFDAITSSRYNDSLYEIEEALEYLKARSGTKFDPGVVDALSQVLPKIHDVNLQFNG